MQAGRSEAFRRRLERDGGCSKSQTEERGDGPSKRVTCQPDLCVWVEHGDVVVEIGPAFGRVGLPSVSTSRSSLGVRKERY